MDSDPLIQNQDGFWHKICICGNVQLYKNKSHLKDAIKRNTTCRKCSDNSIDRFKKISESLKGNKNPNFGKHRICTPETKLKLSISHKGEKNYWFGKKLSDNHKRKLSEIRRIYTDEEKCSIKEQRGHFYKWLRGSYNGFDKYIGCSLPHFKKWIESKWYLNMSWKNYGIIWHIDHQYPLSSFNLATDDGIKKAWYWHNLQPMTCAENLSKGRTLHPSQNWFEFDFL
jgi:hypothetical protein